MIGEMPSSRTKIAIIKVRGGMRVQVVVLAADALGVHVHWLGTRSYMCPGVDCAACFAGVGARWVGFLPVKVEIEQASESHVGLLELTGGTYERLAGLRKMLGLETLLGVGCVASRSRDRATLRMEPTIESADEVLDVRAFPDWLLCDGLATLYGLPTCPDGFSHADWESTAVPRAAQLIRTALPRAVR